MDLAKTLIRSVARSFYDLHHVLVVDALMVHSALSVDDMHLLTSVQQKDLRKYLGRLREDRLISVQQRQEVKQNTTRPIHRDYYYINHHLAIDAIKYRIFHLTEKVKALYKPSEEKKDYFCPRCRSQFTTLEVLDNPFAGGFLCHRCNNALEREEISTADRAGSERQSRLMAQIDPLLTLLKKIDAEEIPQNDFQSALAVAIPVRRNEETHPTQLYEPIKEESKPSAKIKSEAMLDLDVTIATEEGHDEAEQRARELKAMQEKQNALPSWYTESTIGIKADPDTASPVAGTAPTSAAAGIAVKQEDTKEEKKPSIADADAVEAYYASLKEEEERRNALPSASESESSSGGEEDEDGFEDVEIDAKRGANGNGASAGLGTGGTGTPMSSLSATLNGNVKKRRLSEDEGGMMNGALGSSPVTSTPDGGRSPSKKIKLEPGTEGDAVGGDVVPVKVEAGSDDEDDEEFEDAL